MSYFSRLSDIVTCNLRELLAREADPQSAIERLITEIEEGLAGARRSVAAAQTEADRIQGELEQLRAQVASWHDRAREALSAGDDQRARRALLRKREAQDLLAGLEQQHRAALGTLEQLTTTLRALEARLVEAHRLRHELHSGQSVEAAECEDFEMPASAAEPRIDEIEQELEALRRELEQS